MDTQTFAMTQDHRADAPRPLEPGASLGSYLILDRLSTSRFAEVYLAHDVTLDRAVVLKTTPPGANPTDAAGLRHEAQALARARNPYVVTLHTIDESRPAPILVLEHLVGQTLAQRLERRGPLPVPAAIELFVKLLTGIEQMHHAGVIHGNIKPDNLFLTTDGLPKLLGSRLAAFGDRPALGPRARSPDLLYCAPECRGAPATDPRADLFSLGLCLYEAMTGVLPFEKKERPRRRRSPSPALLAVLTRATSKDPAARFPSAVAFRDALTTATAAGPDQRRAKGTRRFLRALAFDTALVTVLAGLVLALGLYPFSETPEKATAATEEATAPRAAKQGIEKSRTGGIPDKQDKYDALRHAWREG
jgi:serine/threonine protein kinase